MSDTALFIIAISVPAATVIAAIIAAIVQLIRSRAAGVQEKHVQDQENDLARDAHDLNVLREGVAFLREEVVRLRVARVEDREELTRQRSRIEDLEVSTDQLATENRTFREVVIGVMERLRRKPPDEPESILAYILTHLPHLGKDHTS